MDAMMYKEFTAEQFLTLHSTTMSYCLNDIEILHTTTCSIDHMFCHTGFLFALYVLKNNNNKELSGKIV